MLWSLERGSPVLVGAGGGQRRELSSMDPVCDFCGIVRAVVYCKSDSARLCLQCDGCVHSANLLSRRHARSLLCDKCCSQHATVRCMDEKLSLCQGCDWSGNGCSGPGHRRQVLNCYTGCPMLSEFASIWSSVLDPPCSSDLDGRWGPLSALPMDGNGMSNLLEDRDCEGSYGTAMSKRNEFGPWMGPTALLTPNANYTQLCKDQAPFTAQEFNLPKVMLLLSSLISLRRESIWLKRRGKYLLQYLLMNIQTNPSMCSVQIPESRFSLN